MGYINYPNHIADPHVSNSPDFPGWWPVFLGAGIYTGLHSGFADVKILIFAWVFRKKNSKSDIKCIRRLVKIIDKQEQKIGDGFLLGPLYLISIKVLEIAGWIVNNCAP